jgi:hypothetical protein
MKLTPDQIKFIRCEIFKRGVRLESLQEDLLDHICCLVEEELALTPNFKQAYLKAVSGFGNLRLLHVQTDEAIQSVKNFPGLYKFLDYCLTFALLNLCLWFIFYPVYLSFQYNKPSFILMFCHFMLFGLYFCLARINYKTFEIVPFKEKVFPNRLIP